MGKAPKRAVIMSIASQNEDEDTLCGYSFLRLGILQPPPPQNLLD
jgi:hypothetical protein